MEFPEDADKKPPRGSFISLEAFAFWVSLKAKTESQCLLYPISTLAFTKEAQKYQFILILTI